jgi:signal transduction histidine kinase
VREDADAERLCIEVEDHGPGVPAADIEHLFEPFFTTKAQGTGLGLARAYSVMEGHGGSIAYAEGAAGGALFRLLFPRWHGATA